MQTTKYFLCICSLFCLFSACKTQTEDKTAQPSYYSIEKIAPIDSLSYPLGFNYEAWHFGVSEDKYIYFANIASSRQLKIFEYGGELLADIPLHNILRESNIFSFFVFSPDSILVLSKYTNILYKINGKGDILQKTKVNIAGDDIFELNGSLQTFPFFARDTILFTLEWRAYKKDPKKGENIQEFYKGVWQANKFLKVCINNLDSTITTQTAFPMYKYLFPTDSVDKLYLGSINYYNCKKGIFVYTSYVNKILELNKNLEPIREHEIISEDLGIPKKKLLHIKEINKVLDVFTAGSFLYGFHWDKYRSLYYVIILKGIVSETFKYSRDRPFRLLIYNEDFKKIKEIDFSDYKYTLTDVFVHPKGLAIKRRSKKIVRYEDRKALFDIFVF